MDMMDNVSTYAEAIEYLDQNYSWAQQKGIAGNNRFEVYCAEQGIVPTEEELTGSEDFAYDWFMALYYNQPQLLEDMVEKDVTAILEAAISFSAKDADMRYLIARSVARYSTR